MQMCTGYICKVFANHLVLSSRLCRQLGTSLASVVLFEEEIRRGQRAAKLAALDRIELSEQLAARTQEAIESETKFTRMVSAPRDQKVHVPHPSIFEPQLACPY